MKFSQVDTSVHHMFEVMLKTSHATIIFENDRVIDCNESAIQLFEATDKFQLLETPVDKLFYTTGSSKALFQNILKNTEALESWKANILCLSFKKRIFHSNTSFTFFNLNGNKITCSIWVDFVDSRSVYTGGAEIGRDSILISKEERHISEGSGEIRNVKDDSTVLNASKYGKIQYDVKSNVLRLEPKIAEVLGVINLSHSESGGISPETFTVKYVTENKRSEVLQTWSHLKKVRLISSAQSRIEFTIINDFGHIKHVRILLKNVLSDTGELIKYHGIISDCSDQIEFEAKLSRYKTNLEQLVRKRNEQLDQVKTDLIDTLEFANLNSWEYDVENDLFRISGNLFRSRKDKTRDFASLPTRYLTYVDIENYLREDDFLIFKSRVSSLVENAPTGHLEFLQLRSKSTGSRLRYFHVSMKFLNDGKKRKVYGTIQDITQIKRTEVENEKLIELVEATDDIVLIVNDQNCIEYINGSGKSFFDLNLNLASESTNQKKSELIEIINVGLKTALRDGFWRGELLFPGKRENTPFSTQIRVHKSASGVQFISVVSRDISRQKQIEENLVKKNKELDTYLYRTSHDFRAPITTLLGLSKLASLELKDPEALKYIKLFEEQFNRLQELNANISKLISIEEEVFYDDLSEIFNLSDLINDLTKELKVKNNFNEFDLCSEGAQSFDCSFRAMEMLKTLLYNLADNSIKFRSGKQRLKIGMSITIDRNEQLSIIVSDNGTGISADILPKIFDMFYRGNESSRGFGLGLFNVRKIVERLNGAIDVESEINKGTTFKVKIPYPLNKSPK